MHPVGDAPHNTLSGLFGLAQNLTRMIGDEQKDSQKEDGEERKELHSARSLLIQWQKPVVLQHIWQQKADSAGSAAEAYYVVIIQV